MIATWMLYSLSVTLLLGLAAVGVETALGSRRTPRRAIWGASMLVSFGISAIALFWPAEELVAPSIDPSYAGEAFQLTPISLTQPVRNGVSDWLVGAADAADPALIAIWGFTSAVMLLYSVVAAVRLRVLRRRWVTMSVRGRKLLVSRDTGPAVVGFLSSSIVIPQWVLDDDPTLRDLMLAHEQEHLDAGDPKLLLAALTLLALTPWNVPLWWQLKRMRLAIELDCDARVLDRVSDRKMYASLLLEVGRRRSLASLTVAAFAQKPSYLERRIRMITDPGRQRTSTSVAAGAIALAMVAAAWHIDRPTIVRPLSAAEPALLERLAETGPELLEKMPSTELPASGAGLAAAPAPADAAPARPDTIPPPPGPGNRAQQVDEPGRMLNIAEVQQNLERFYPPLLRDAGVGGTAELQMYISPEGKVLESRLARTSGERALDLAAQRVAATINFSPFRFRGDAVGVWLNMPFTFDPNGRSAGSPPPPPNDAAGADVGPGRPLAAGVPNFPGNLPLSELSRPPALINMTEVQAALRSHFPAEARSAGISGRVTVRIYIGADGRVLESYPVSASDDLFMEAADAIARVMRFRPAEKDGESVPVWVEMPVNFQSG